MKVPAGIASLVVLASTVLIGCGGDERADSDAAEGTESGDLLEAVRSSIPLPEIDLGPPPSERVPGPSYVIARVQSGDEIELHESPGGRVFEKVRERTEFGSIRTFWAAQVKDGWLGVPVPELPNGKLAWIEDNRNLLDVYETPFWIEADVSAQRLELRYGKRVLDRFPVTVGSAGSPTPLGEYSVTDGLAGEGVGPYYGCCILALTGHQPRLPPDWLGGDRIAIHGTPEQVGGATSAGCLRASDPDLVSLFARVPLGAPVFIRA